MRINLPSFSTHTFLSLIREPLLTELGLVRSNCAWDDEYCGLILAIADGTGESGVHSARNSTQVLAFLYCLSYFPGLKNPLFLLLRITVFAWLCPLTSHLWSCLSWFLFHYAHVHSIMEAVSLDKCLGVVPSTISPMVSIACSWLLHLPVAPILFLTHQPCSDFCSFCWLFLLPGTNASPAAPHPPTDT